MSEQLRAYFFGNMYLSSIQQGIQAAHVVAELFVKYPDSAAMQESVDLDNWATNHKTMILLNGGYGSTLHDLIDLFDNDDNPYPFSFFKESEAALDNALTSVGIILPEKIYEGARKLRNLQTTDIAAWRDKKSLTLGIFPNQKGFKYTDWEVEMMERLNCFRLAN